MSTQIPGLYIMETESKGRGVFTSVEINEGDIIESAPVIVLSHKDRLLIHETKLHDFYFLWGQAQKNENGDKIHLAAIALGFGSLYNHEEDANAKFICYPEDQSIDFVATRRIEPGEEICINYNDGSEKAFPLWSFD